MQTYAIVCWIVLVLNLLLWLGLHLCRVSVATEGSERLGGALYISCPTLSRREDMMVDEKRQGGIGMEGGRCDLTFQREAGE